MYPLILLFLIVTCAPSVFSQQDNTQTTIHPIPVTAKFDGVIKTKMEISAENGMIRFNVRNSRLGVRGDIGKYAGYRVQVELSNEGSFAPLDLFGSLKPARGLSVHLGQTSIPFENPYIISPSEAMFSNRAFVGKYFTPGSRDIGGTIHYKLPSGFFPLETQAGLFNGGKINNPQWTDKPSYALRVIAGRMDGFRASAKIYKYNSEILDMTLWGADIHYANDHIRLEAEVMNRKSHPDEHNLFGTYIQGAYVIDLPTTKMFHNLLPAFRWDAMGYDVPHAGFDVNRLTFGLNFGLSLKPFNSLLRINYEQYFLRHDSFTEFDNRDPYVSDNKVTVELLFVF